VCPQGHPGTGGWSGDLGVHTMDETEEPCDAQATGGTIGAAVRCRAGGRGDRAHSCRMTHVPAQKETTTGRRTARTGCWTG